MHGPARPARVRSARRPRRAHRAHRAHNAAWRALHVTTTMRATCAMTKRRDDGAALPRRHDTTKPREATTRPRAPVRSAARGCLARGRAPRRMVRARPV
ncbi:hypothetical protein WS83_11820 [Burkholderia sp. MSMB2042]|nr:hypothetical protein WS77_18935 [Burkholderia sp. MSMB0265]KVG92272.1 hypothetical protein WS83_11820 [Burkholderia sp. MSMB2042]